MNKYMRNVSLFVRINIWGCWTTTWRRTSPHFVCRTFCGILFVWARVTCTDACSLFLERQGGGEERVDGSRHFLRRNQYFSPCLLVNRRLIFHTMVASTTNNNPPNSVTTRKEVDTKALLAQLAATLLELGLTLAASYYFSRWWAVHMCCVLLLLHDNSTPHSSRLYAPFTHKGLQRKYKETKPTTIPLTISGLIPTAVGM